MWIGLPTMISRRLILRISFTFLLIAVFIFVLNTLWKKNTENLFRKYVHSPIPKSVSRIKVDKPFGHGGYEYVFRFKIKREDFESLRKSRSLRKINIKGYIIDGKGISWVWEDMVPSSGKEGGVGMPIYSGMHVPSWYDLPTWDNPEAFAIHKEDENKNTYIQILLYNNELGQAYFITYYHRYGI